MMRRERGLLDAEAGAAAAARGGVGIGDLEGGAAEALDEIDGRAAHQIERDRIDDQSDAVFLTRPRRPRRPRRRARTCTGSRRSRRRRSTGEGSPACPAARRSPRRARRPKGKGDLAHAAKIGTAPSKPVHKRIGLCDCSAIGMKCRRGRICHVRANESVRLVRFGGRAFRGGPGRRLVRAESGPNRPDDALQRLLRPALSALGIHPEDQRWVASISRCWCRFISTLQSWRARRSARR